MARPDSLLLPTSNLNPFLFAAVGIEPNGSELTILSLFARLGSDPWAEAGRLAAMPKGAASEWLAEQIARTPLTSKALAEARATASRLVLLLPTASSMKVTGVAAAVATASVPVPPWAMIAMLLGALVVGVAASSFHASTAPSTEQTTQHDPSSP